ncbi:MAG TPA: hypothetical protein VG123_12970, partial [Streptosporangiaceae bacterium]|nr:hypothetical protein [Streptosporangiaceae bacterium]
TMSRWNVLRLQALPQDEPASHLGPGGQIMWVSGPLPGVYNPLCLLEAPGERRARISRFICSPAGVRPTVIADAKPV